MKQLIQDFKKTGILFYVIALQLAGILIVAGKGAGQIYLDMILILLAMTLGLFFFARVVGGNVKIAIYTSVLLTIGVMLQVIFKQEAILAKPDLYGGGNPVMDLQIQYLVAFLAAAGVAILYRKGKFLANPKVIKGMYLTSVALYVVTLIFAKAVGTAKNWIIIGGFSIQTSEVNKLLYILTMAGILGGVEHPSKKRIGFSFLVTITNLFFLLLQSEFGTMLLILVVFPVYLVLFVPDLRIAIGTILGYIGIGVGAAGVGQFVVNLAEKNVAFGKLSFVQFFLINYDKIVSRFALWANPEQDPLGTGYQILRARDAILLGGWFGTDSITNLPVKTSDMVFPALIERCGIIMAILVLIVIVMLFLEGIRVFVTKKDKYHRAVCAGIVFLLFYQALIIVAGSCGMCPLTGITLPFISSGGTSLLVCCVMIGIVIAISGQLSWEGEMDHEEMELEFKLPPKSADYAESILAFGHRCASKFNQNISRITGRIRRGGCPEDGSGVCPDAEGICEGTDCGSDGGDSGKFTGTSGAANLQES